MARLRPDHGEAQRCVGWLLVRCLSPEAGRVEPYGCFEQGVQGEACSSESSPRRPRLLPGGHRWLDAVRTPRRAPRPNGGFRKLGVAPPDWRITCFFVDRDRRREGIAEAALAGALRIIATKGGGTVDGYPLAAGEKPDSSSFLWGGTESMFAKVGFRPLGSLGTRKMVMRRVVRKLQERGD